jgi:hypothetical protein
LLSSLGLPPSPLRHDCGIFIGYPLIALTFLNRQRSSPGIQA